jgi:hypothetical protein
MAGFVIASLYKENNPVIEARLVELFPEDHYKIRPNLWLVSFKGTARILYDKIIPDEESFLATSAGILVFRINSYWGLAQAEMWEWLSTAMKKGEPSPSA